MNSVFFASPRVFVEIYMHEGGKYAIDSAHSQILACTTDKSMKSPAGTFEIMLAPGGPNGANVGPSWLDVITPMSFVMIGMTRGVYQGIVMLGVVTHIREVWNFDSQPVTRNVMVSGQDVGYFFTHFSWYALTFVNGPAAAIGLLIGNTDAGTLQGLGSGLYEGSPDVIGAAWYQKVMDASKGILSKTWLQYGKNNQIPFGEQDSSPGAITVQFEKYIDAVKILYSFAFTTSGETWWQKFSKIFPWPWYEFFIMTAPSGFYSQALSTSWNQVSTGISFSMEKLPNLEYKIYVIARVNPLPRIIGQSSGQGSFTFGSLDTTAWNKLVRYSEETRLVLTQEEFCEEEIRNFYVINPTFMKNLWGQANDAVTSPLYGIGAAVDPASIHRYGFRPAYMETEWFSDPSGQTAQGQKLDLNQIFATLMGQLAAQFEPVSLMMRASRRGMLRPDIIPGNVYTYQPLKETTNTSTNTWTYYIDGVTHSYRFGGPSQTVLQLARGLPTDVYSNSSLLEAIHKGNAQRLDGIYQTGLPSGPVGTETGLESVNLLSSDVQKVLADIAPIYSTAQKQ